MIGFAARPGTDVDPTWSIADGERRRALRGSRPPPLRTSRATRGRVRRSPYSCVRPSVAAGLGDRASRVGRAGRARRTTTAAPGRSPRCPPGATARRPSRARRRAAAGRARSPRPGRPRSTRRARALADAIDALVVMRRARRGRRLRSSPQAAARLDRDVVQRLRVHDGHAVLEHPGEVGQVRMQRPAERDVHDLHAAADAEGRHAGSHRLVQQPDLDRVPVGLDAVDVRGSARRRSARDRRRRRRRGAARRRARAAPRDRPSHPGERIAVRAPAAGAPRGTAPARRSRRAAIAPPGPRRGGRRPRRRAAR